MDTYTLNEVRSIIDFDQWNRVNMPDRIIYMPDNSTGRMGCGCRLQKINDDCYIGFICDNHNSNEQKRN